jgi:hypothetical protein
MHSTNHSVYLLKQCVLIEKVYQLIFKINLKKKEYSYQNDP